MSEGVEVKLGATEVRFLTELARSTHLPRSFLLANAARAKLGVEPIHIEDWERRQREKESG